MRIIASIFDDKAIIPWQVPCEGYIVSSQIQVVSDSVSESPIRAAIGVFTDVDDQFDPTPGEGHDAVEVQNKVEGMTVAAEGKTFVSYSSKRMYFERGEYIHMLLSSASASVECLFIFDFEPFDGAYIELTFQWGTLSQNMTIPVDMYLDEIESTVSIDEPGSSTHMVVQLIMHIREHKAVPDDLATMVFGVDYDVVTDETHELNVLSTKSDQFMHEIAINGENAFTDRQFFYPRGLKIDGGDEFVYSKAIHIGAGDIDEIVHRVKLKGRVRNRTRHRLGRWLTGDDVIDVNRMES